MDDLESTSASGANDLELVLELDVDDSQPTIPEAKAPVSANGSAIQKPALALTVDQPKEKGATAPQPAFHKSEEPEPQILSQTVYDDDGSDSPLRALMIVCIFGLIGALCFAGVSAIYFSIGRRAGVICVAICAAIGVRMGAQDLRGNRIRWHAAFTAGVSAIVGKALLVALLFQMHPDFTAEDWTNFADPGKSSAIYFEQSVENALSIDGSDSRTSQEKLDDKFEAAMDGSEEESAGNEESDSDYEEGEAMKFSEVFPKVFDIFDLPLILGGMLLAFRFTRCES